MKVRVIWQANNPFLPVEKRDVTITTHLTSEIIQDDTQIEAWAHEATPEGFHLHQIDCTMWVMHFDDNGNRITTKQ